jgi:hypothetical protein
MEMVKLSCCHCGAEYLRYGGWVKRDVEKRGYKNYCSKECISKARTKEIPPQTCLECGKVFYRKQNKNERVFCSKLCANQYIGRERIGKICGINHPNYNSGKSSYRNIINEDSKCYYCDYKDIRVLVVHHIDRNRDNNEIDNLLVVCPTHHIELHRGIKIYI